MNVSVLICTKNPDLDTLLRVLHALPKSIPCGEIEVLLIDNSSVPPLDPETFAQTGLALRIICEPVVGSLNARRTAMKAAKGDLCIFVDDDNVLAPDYIQNAQDFMRKNPEVGAAGGKIIGEFKKCPEPWMTPHLDLLAIRDLGPDESISKWQNGQSHEFPYNAPYGAGMILRKECIQAYFAATENPSFLLVGRRGTRFLGGCEDAEIVLFGVLKAGWQTGYSPALSLTHVIAPRRVVSAYLNQLAFQTGISWGQFCVRHGFSKRIPKWTIPPRMLRAFFRDKAWSKSGMLTWKTNMGRCIGRADKPPASSE